MRKTGTWGVIVLLVLSTRTLAGRKINLSEAVIFAPSAKTIRSKAALMIRDEIEKRTRIRLDIVSKTPAGNQTGIIIATVEDMPEGVCSLPKGLLPPRKSGGYALWVANAEQGAARVCLVGRDERGALYAAGRLLRLLKMRRDEVTIDSDVRLATAPKYSLRGHQVGYRPKTNSYDAWTVDMWEQYYRDMVVFGANAVELIPPRSDDDPDSPHFPLPKMEMMVEMSRLGDEYGLDVWIWYPVVDDDQPDAEIIERSLKERAEVFSRLARIDAVFVPGGDPGEIHPRQLLVLMARQKEILNRYHPKARIWVSPQGFDWDGEGVGWLKLFYDMLHKEEPAWLDGVVYGPQVTGSIAEMRAKLPTRYPIRRYPDITHCLDAQYQVPDWDPAFHLTLYREPINPRPLAYAEIFREWDEYTVGFITYSEGVNDDVNKVVWSCLGWDHEMKVKDILKEYSRYFVSSRFEDRFAEGLLSLERNWRGKLLTNVGVYETLKIFQEMEADATPQEKLNWRFQLALCRAYYDAYTRRRLIYETELEEKAMDVLRNAGHLGSLAALEKAESILDQAVTEKVATDWRARTFELAEALFQSIRMQLSVERYQAKSVRRGGNLDLIDVPLNNGRELKKLFVKIRDLRSEKDRLAEIARITAERYEMKTKRDKEVILEGMQ